MIFRNEFLLDFFSKFLVREGYNIFASSGENEILKIIEKEEFNLVLLENGLPRVNGKTFVGRIKEKSDIPVMLVIAGGIDEKTIISLQEGAADYIEAPIDLGVIRDKIKNLLQLKEG